VTAVLASISWLAFQAVATATAPRTFVSAQSGSDSNSCTPTAPCRTFGVAIAAASAGGEVVVLDSGGYGGVTIAKAITIQAPPGIYAGVTVASGDAVTIAAGAFDTIVLKGLTIRATVGGSGNGILLTSGIFLRVESCVIQGWNTGINFTGPATLTVKDSTIADQTFAGIRTTAASGHTIAAYDHCRFENNGNNGSMLSLDNTVCVVRDSVMTGNNVGAGALGSSGAPAETNVENCVIVGSQAYGVIAGNAFSTVRLSNTQVVGNVIGVNVNGGGTVESYGTNEIRGNGTDVSGGSITTVPKT
jgi:hypothetical protein